MKQDSRLPIFRSPEQERLLGVLFVYADSPVTLSELASLAGTSMGGTHKEVERLEAAGLTKSRTIGRSRLIEADDSSPVYLELKGLLMKTVGPRPLLKTALSGVAGIAEAFIYGSWADPEALNPRDIDVMVIGNPDVDEVYCAVEVIERQIGRQIDVTIRSGTEWSTADDAFATRVKQGPRLDLIDPPDSARGLGHTVALALRRLQQEGVGEDLRAPLTEAEVQWLDADLQTFAELGNWGPEEDWTEWQARVANLEAVDVDHKDVVDAVHAANDEIERA